MYSDLHKPLQFLRASEGVNVCAAKIKTGTLLAGVQAANIKCSIIIILELSSLQNYYTHRKDDFTGTDITI